MLFLKVTVGVSVIFLEVERKNVSEILAFVSEIINLNGS